jgi:hypothetical protein
MAAAASLPASPADMGRNMTFGSRYADRQDAELVKEGAITAEDAAPIELVEEEVEAPTGVDDDPSDILAFSNVIPLPTVEMDSAPGDADVVAAPATVGGEAQDGAPSTWASVFQASNADANGAHTNGHGNRTSRNGSAAEHTQLSLFDL